METNENNVGTSNHLISHSNIIDDKEMNDL